MFKVIKNKKYILNGNGKRRERWHESGGFLCIKGVEFS